MATYEEILYEEVAGPDRDPLNRGYDDMSDIEVANDLNTRYRDGRADPGALFVYLASEAAKTATETTATVIYGRLARVVDAGAGAVGTGIFATTPELTEAQLDACATFKTIADQDRLAAVAAIMTDARFQALLNLVKAAGVLQDNDIAAITALSQNKQTRAQELGLPRVLEGHVNRVRAA